MFVKVHLEALMIGNWTEPDADQLAEKLQHWQQQLPGTGQRLARQSHSTNGLGPVWLELADATGGRRPGDLSAGTQIVALKPWRCLCWPIICYHLSISMRLRTEQQLGYLVGTGYVPMDLKPGIAFYMSVTQG